MSMASARYSTYNETPSGGGGGGGSGAASGGPGPAANQLVDPESLYTKQGQIGEWCVGSLSLFSGMC